MHFLSWLESIYFFLNKDEKRSYDTHDIIVISMMFLEMLCMFGFALTHYFYGDYFLTSVQLTLGTIFLVSLLVPNKKLPVRYKEDIAISSLIIVFWAMLASGGIVNSGIYWSPMLPFIVFTMSGVTRGFGWLLFYLLGVATLQLLNYYDYFESPYSLEQVFYFLIAFVVYTLIALVFEVVRTRYRLDLEGNNKKLIETQGELSELLDNLAKEIEIQTFELKSANTLLQQEIEHHKETNELLRVSEQKFYRAQKMESLGTLVNGLAHDFSNVLSGIDENLFVIQRNIKGNDLVQDKLDEVEKLVRHATDTTKQLQTFARQNEVDKESFDLRALMKQVLKLAPLSLPSNVKLEKRVSDTAMPVIGSPTQIQQVMINLFNNARDALSGQENPTITLNAMRFKDAAMSRRTHPALQGEWLYVSVSDNGRGIDAVDLPHVFDPFFSTKGLGQGMGLGLAMSYGVIQSHDGMIEVESELNVGTTFHVYLPMEHTTKIHDQQSIHQKLLGRGETILLVDDDEVFRKAYRDVLGKFNYHVVDVASGSEAIRLYAEKGDRIDLIVMDIMMPKADGIQTSQHILTMNKDAKILFSSGYGIDEQKEMKEKGLGHIKLLKKPFAAENLCRLIREELDGNDASEV